MNEALEGERLRRHETNIVGPSPAPLRPRPALAADCRLELGGREGGGSTVFRDDALGNGPREAGLCARIVTTAST